MDVNPAYEKVAQIPAEAIRGKSPKEFINKVSKESVERALASYKKCTEEKRSYSYEEMLVVDGYRKMVVNNT